MTQPSLSSAIFISYRRDEASGFAGRLYDQLAKTFGADRVFMDVGSIEPGVNFRNAMMRGVDRSAVLLVIIGPHWLDLTDENGVRRLDNGDDPVRVEIETAMARNIVVIPVLMDGTPMPDRRMLPTTIQELAQIHAIRLRHDSFSSDIERLLEVLSRHINPGPPSSTPDRRRITKPLLVTLAMVAVLAISGIIWLTVNPGHYDGSSGGRTESTVNSTTATYEAPVSAPTASPSTRSTEGPVSQSTATVGVAEIDAPSADGYVSNPVVVKGTAMMPAGMALWILILAPDNRYYLTTDGPVTVGGDGHWATRLTAGRGPQDAGITFSLFAVSAPASTSTFDAKVATKRTTGSSGGFDILPPDAVNLDRIDLHLSG